MEGEGGWLKRSRDAANCEGRKPAAVGGAGSGGVGAGGGGQRLQLPLVLPLAQVGAGLQPAAAHHARRRERRRRELRHDPRRRLQPLPALACPPHRRRLFFPWLRRPLALCQPDRLRPALLGGE